RLFPVSDSGMVPHVSARPARGGFVGLRRAASIAVLAGAVCSVGFLLRATGRNPSQILVALMAIWVVSPFMALLWASFASKPWSAAGTRVAVRRDAACFAELFGHLRGRCPLAPQLAARFRVHRRSPGVMAAQRNRC